MAGQLPLKPPVESAHCTRRPTLKTSYEVRPYAAGGLGALGGGIIQMGRRFPSAAPSPLTLAIEQDKHIDTHMQYLYTQW